MTTEKVIMIRVQSSLQVQDGQDGHFGPQLQDWGGSCHGYERSIGGRHQGSGQVEEQGIQSVYPDWSQAPGDVGAVPE